MVLSEILRLSVRLCASLSAGHVCPAESAMILSRHVVRWVMGIKTLPWGLSGTMRLRNRCHASVCILEDSGTSLLAAPNGLKGFVRFLCVVGSDLLPPPSRQSESLFTNLTANVTAAKIPDCVPSLSHALASSSVFSFLTCQPFLGH